MASTWIGVLSLNQAAVESFGGDIKRTSHVRAHNTRTLNLTLAEEGCMGEFVCVCLKTSGGNSQVVWCSRCLVGD